MRSAGPDLVAGFITFRISRAMGDQVVGKALLRSKMRDQLEQLPDVGILKNTNDPLQRNCDHLNSYINNSKKTWPNYQTSFFWCLHPVRCVFLAPGSEAPQPLDVPCVFVCLVRRWCHAQIAVEHLHLMRTRLHSKD